MPEALLSWEFALQWAGVTLYAAAAAALIYALSFGKERALSIGLALAAAGLLPHGGGLLLRWSSAGHGPYMAKYEVLSSNAWVAAACFVLAGWRRPGLRGAGAVVVPAAMLMTAAGLMLSPDIRRLPPALRSVWLVLHVVFAKLAAGGLLLALGASVLYLLKERGRAPLAASLPSLERLDDYARRFAGFGFAFWSIMIAAGAIWANESWGRYWGWDPIETWSLVTWLLIGVLLHLRRFFGWRGARAAWSLAACFALSVFTLFGVPLLAQSIHAEYFR